MKISLLPITFLLPITYYPMSDPKSGGSNGMEISREKLISDRSCTVENLLFWFEASAFFSGYSNHYGVIYIVSATGIAIFTASRVIKMTMRERISFQVMEVVANNYTHSLSRASGYLLDTQTLKKDPSGHPIFGENFLKMSISSIELKFFI